MKLGAWWTAAPALALAAVAAGFAVTRGAAPSADVSRGSEEAFATGLEWRELPPRQPPLRWTTRSALFRFRNLPKGRARLEVRIHAHRTPVYVEAGGAALGRIEVGERERDLDLEVTAGALDVRLRTEGFVAPGERALGTLLDRVSLQPAAGSLPLFFVLQAWLMACVVWWSAGMAACGPWQRLAAGLAAIGLGTLLLLPCGLAFSPYAAVLLAAAASGGLAAAFLARLLTADPSARRAAFIALLTAIAVQGLTATSPMLVESDVALNANKLQQVAHGDFFPTSVTQHSPPFQIPYGVAFYALLVPFARAGVSPIELVRLGAAASGLLGSVALLALLLPKGASRAAVAVVALQFLPSTFERYSFGNLPNVFGQAATTAFFSWWAGNAWGGGPIGGALLLLASLGHFSSFIVLAALLPALVWVRRSELAADRKRLAALGLGLGLAALYYAHFVPLIVAQLPRLLEGGGRGASAGAWQAFAAQAFGVLGQFGPAALVLGFLGRPREANGLDLDLRAYWVAGVALFAAALVSPLEVRYLYALTVPMAVAVGAGWERLWAKRRIGATLAWLLLAALVWWGAIEIREAVVQRYRPGVAAGAPGVTSFYG